MDQGAFLLRRYGSSLFGAVHFCSSSLLEQFTSGAVHLGPVSRHANGDPGRVTQYHSGFFKAGLQAAP
ncbi:hypothetical protein JQ610_15275 [Bradyrhizobium diazoefficiens]|nr:hypothetical protein [Bradyrhizobium diazoefficiens]MBR1008233.1 hypothetical protein [Bradyrhizobium diazoefficiens]MBR1013835.1 hypothetical protein [Bradyrhizobium diazoefficiens]MBR1109314.1 hypothetical protein [Bradyrhizobium diazoefficiens]